jgi:bifunctional UDP-N-acetylglucosamine pyrophosphorylase / glucosamine-1-phosphate N-acetyltransferase
MRSTTPKVLHAIGGRTLIVHAVAAAAGLEPEHLVVVVRHGRDQVVAHLAEQAPGVLIADQDEVPGTARATRCGLAALSGLPPLQGTIVVTYGDVPLLTTRTLARVVAEHQLAGRAVTILTSEPEDPAAYGRVVRDTAGAVVSIVEHRDATSEQVAICEINTGIYAFDAEFLGKALDRVGTDNAAGEAYLTDVVGLAAADGLTVGAVLLADPVEAEGVNDRVQLARLGRVLRDRTVERWMLAGVTVIDPQTTWIDVDVELAPDVTLLPGCQLHGRTRVASGCSVGPDSTLVDCELAEGASVIRSLATGAVLGAGARAGPFAYLRPGTRLGAGGRIGAFVETKDAVIGVGTKVPHLSYVGDAQIGEGTNIGAATIFVNYDGVDKHRTVVGDHVRIGSDTMLVAPVVIGDGAYTAAGSVIASDVPAGALGVGRARQRTIEGWVARKRAGSASARAAELASAQPTVSAPAQPTVSAPAQPTVSAPAQPTMSAEPEDVVSAEATVDEIERQGQ